MSDSIDKAVEKLLGEQSETDFDVFGCLDSIDELSRNIRKLASEDEDVYRFLRDFCEDIKAARYNLKNIYTAIASGKKT